MIIGGKVVGHTIGGITSGASSRRGAYASLDHGPAFMIVRIGGRGCSLVPFGREANCKLQPGNFY